MIRPVSPSLLTLFLLATSNSLPLSKEENYSDNAKPDTEAKVLTQTMNKVSTVSTDEHGPESEKTEDPRVTSPQEFATVPIHGFAEGSQASSLPQTYYQRGGYNSYKGGSIPFPPSYPNPSNLPMTSASDIVILRQILQQQSDIKQILMHMADRQATLQDSLFRIETHMTHK